MDDLRLPYTHDDYTIGWVCALPKEQSAAIFMLDERHEDLPNPSGDQNAYTLGSIGKHKIVIAGLPKGRVGTNSAATVATRMVSSFPNIRVGLMVGIGGGIPQKTRLGDVVISCPSGTEPGVIQWDMGKAEADGHFLRTGSLAPPPTALLTALNKFEADQITTRTNILSYLKNLESIPNIPKRFLKSDSLQDILYESSYNHVEGDDCRFCDKSRVIQRNEREDDMMIHCGLIASGNQVMKDAILRDKLYEKFNNNLLCIEMEAAGLMNDFPCVVIRGICDYADSHKNEKWQDYAAATAAACAKALLMVVPTSEVDKLQRVQLTISPGLVEGAKRYFSFWRGDKKDADPSVPNLHEETKEKNGVQLPQTPPPETVTPSDTNLDAKSRETAHDEMPTQTIPTEMSAHRIPTEMPTQTSTAGVSTKTNPENIPSTQHAFETWLREAPSSLATMLQQGNIEAAVKNIYVGLRQFHIPQEGVNETQSYAAGGYNSYRDVGRSFEAGSGNYAQMPSPSPGRSKSWGDVPSQASAPFLEEYRGHASEQTHSHGNVGWNVNTAPYPPRTPSPFQPGFRGYGQERCQTYSNDGTAPLAPQNLQRPIAYPSRTPSPFQTGYRNHIPEQSQNYGNNEQFDIAPAPLSLHISTQYPSNGYDAVANGVRDSHYPWSPPQSPIFRVNPSQDNTLRRVSESQTIGRINSSVYDPATEDDRGFGYKYGNQPYFSEPSAINPNEGYRSATPSQGRQPSPMVKNTSVHGPGTGNNGPSLGHRRFQFSESSPIGPNKGQRSATPIPSQRPPFKAKNTPIHDLATRNNDSSSGFRRPSISESKPINPDERRRSVTRSQGGQPPLMTMSNNSARSLEIGASRPPSRAQPIPPHVLRNVPSQRFSKIPRPRA